MGKDGERGAGNPALAQSPDSNANIVNLLDDEGRVQTQLKGPAGTVVNLAAVSPDGSRLAVFWADPNKWVFTVYDPDSGKQAATSAQDIGFTWDLVFSPDGTRIATAGEDGRISLWDTSTGTMIIQCRGPLDEGAQRRVPPGWPAPRDDLGGWDRPPVGFLDGPGGRVALRSSHRGKS